MYLGVKAVIAKAIERIHKANLINFAITPLLFANPADYDKIDRDDELTIDDLLAAIESGATEVIVHNKTKGCDIPAKLDLTDRQRKLLVAGGLLNYTKAHGA